MTDKLHCPYCNKPLQPTLRNSYEYWCENYDCPEASIELVGSQKLWRELIRTRKALDVAINVLNRVKDVKYEEYIDEKLEQINEIIAPEQKDVK